MRTILTLAALAATLTTAHADTFAVGGVKGDSKGRTVLTTEPCEFKADFYQQGVNKALLGNMRRAFYYTSNGMTNEGCWKHDAGTIVLVWPTENIMRRWPADNFKLAERTTASWESLR